MDHKSEVLHMDLSIDEQSFQRSLSTQSDDSGVYNSEASGSPHNLSVLHYQCTSNEDNDLYVHPHVSDNQMEDCGIDCSQMLDEEEKQASRYLIPVVKRKGLPNMGQLSTCSLSLVSVHHEDPLTWPSRDCQESRSRNYQDVSMTDNLDKAQRNRKRLGSLFTAKPYDEVAGHAKITHSSLPCLKSGSYSLKCSEFKKTNAESMAGQGNNRTIQNSHVSSKENGSDSTCNKMSPKQFSSIDLPVPKDGKYGWIIVFGAFLINMIIDGICLSFGIFYSEFLDYFGQGQSKTAWTGSVLSGTYSLLGPLASGLSNRYGCRLVCICGSIISTLAFLLSILSPNVEILILTYGFIAGLGFSLMYIPAIVMVSFYFEERRALATGITVCGSGIGTFIFAPLTEYLLSVYDWKGAMIVIAGLVLHGVVAGALFKPINKSCRESPSKESQPMYNLTSQAPNLFASQYSCNITYTSIPSIPKSQTKSDHKVDNAEANLFGQVQSTPLLSEKKIPKMSAKGPNSYLLSNLEHRHGWTWKSLDNIADNDTNNHNLRVYATRMDKNYTLYRKDVFYSGSIYNVKETVEDNAANDTNAINLQKKSDKYIAGERIKKIKTSKKINSLELNSELRQEDKTSKVLRKILDILSEMTNFSLFTDPLFLIYCLSCTLTMFGFMIPFVYLPNCAREAGLSKQQGALLLSVLGIANTVGRVFCGWASDKRWVSPIYINAWALVMTGIVTMVQPEIHGFVLLACTAFMFGIGVAVFISLRSILMVDLIGLEKLTNGFGLVSMCQGISLIIGPPVAGFLRDRTNSYRVPFCVAGAVILIAGLLCLPLKYLSQRKPLYVEENEDTNIL